MDELLREFARHGHSAADVTYYDFATLRSIIDAAECLDLMVVGLSGAFIEGGVVEEPIDYIADLSTDYGRGWEIERATANRAALALVEEWSGLKPDLKVSPSIIEQSDWEHRRDQPR